MFDLFCDTCEITYLVDTHFLISLHNTTNGPVGFARCPRGHRTIVRFHERPAGTAEIDRDDAA